MTRESGVQVAAGWVAVKAVITDSDRPWPSEAYYVPAFVRPNLGAQEGKWGTLNTHLSARYNFLGLRPSKCHAVWELLPVKSKTCPPALEFLNLCRSLLHQNILRDISLNTLSSRTRCHAEHRARVR